MHKTLLKLTVTGALFFLLPAMAAAATRIDLNQKQSLNLQATSSAPTEFKEISRTLDANQTLHIRLQQTYAGYKVWGGEAVIHTQNNMPTVKSMVLNQKNRAYSSNGVLFKGLAADLAHSPAYIFTPAQADKAYAQTLRNYYAQIGGSAAVDRPQKELLVYLDDNSKAHWAFLISFFLDSRMPSKPTYIVDAENFSIYKNWDDVKTMDNIAAGGFGGNKKTGRLTYDSIGEDLPSLNMRRNPMQTQCYMQNNEVVIKDVRQNDSVVSFKCVNKDVHHNEYWNDDLDAVNGGYSPSNDALYAGDMIKAMYQDWYHLPVLIKHDGSPMRIVMRVHENIENAYWFMNEMTFGDGGPDFYPLVSLGVAGHEISHGFTEQNSDLIYDKQSGGLNESFSDMAAQAVEFYSSNHNTWEMGSEILKTNKSLRYLDEPTKDCDGGKPGVNCSISNVKDYYPNLNVHYSSGVFNKLFYLLSNSQNWDTRKAFDVMVRANVIYWTPNVSFVNAACGVINAAKDLGYETQAVKSAATGVGINTLNCVFREV
jgi:pseudolysin